jgi:hypothetical protein
MLESRSEGVWWKRAALGAALELVNENTRVRRGV